MKLALIAWDDVFYMLQFAGSSLYCSPLLFISNPGAPRSGEEVLDLMFYIVVLFLFAFFAKFFIRKLQLLLQNWNFSLT
jgi:hypothetical protein